MHVLQAQINCFATLRRPMFHTALQRAEKDKFFWGFSTWKGLTDALAQSPLTQKLTVIHTE